MNPLLAAPIETVLDWIVTYLNTPWMVFATLNLLVFIGWALTLRRHGRLIQSYAEATAWWRFWVEQAVRHGYEPDEAERNAAEELLPERPTIDRQIESVQNHLDAERGDTDA